MTEKYSSFSEEKKQRIREASLKWYHENKEAAALKAKSWRAKNKDYVVQKQREDKRKRKLWAIEYLGGQCTACAQKFHPSVYEFHHKDPSTKDRDPSKMLQLSMERLTEELDKCILLCANCHRFEHNGDKY